MHCPYCAAFGRDLFGEAPPLSLATSECKPPTAPHPIHEEAAGDSGASRADEPSWPVTFARDRGWVAPAA